MPQEIEEDIISDATEAADFPPLSVKNCPNCGEVLTGRFCMSCGQKDYNMLRPFWTLLEETLGDLFSFDSRFFGTILPLFFRPGYITREFNRGRRAHFVPPFRQYLVISIIFFLLLVSIDIQLFDTDDINLDTDGNNIFLNSSDDKQETTNKEKIETLIQTDKFESVLDKAATDMTEKRESNLKDSTDADKNIYDGTIGFLGGVKKVWQDPKLLNVVLADWVPKIMFLMLPLFALFLKLLYIRRKKFYIEHLVFSMHFHAFIFLLFTLILLLYHFLPIFNPYLSYLLWYVPAYLFIAIWTVYGQGPIKSFFKGVFLSFTYLIFMSFGLLIAIAYGLTKI